MIGRKTPRIDDDLDDAPKLRGFDDFDLRLGDTMRGERATMGKSLLDVQRELRIKASYIAAIENSDPSAFDTPGFIAGYVRSYARYLGMNPDEAFAVFCEESGFSVAHGMSEKASSVRKIELGGPAAMPAPAVRDPFKSPNTPFVPSGESVLSQIEFRAIGSVLVLIALISGIGYGGWTVMKEIQQVQVAPVEQAPVVLSDLDPLDEARGTRSGNLGETAPNTEALDRLYRPQALDVPVLVARDAPISTLDPRTVGTFAAPDLPEVQIASNQRVDHDLSAFGPTDSLTSFGRETAAAGAGQFGPPAPGALTTPQVVASGPAQLQMVAVRPAWVRVSAADGTVIFEGIMEDGDVYTVPSTEEPPKLRTGESGAIYFTMNGTDHFGPVGPRGQVTSNVPLSAEEILNRYTPAKPESDQDLFRYVAELQPAPSVTD